MAEAFEKAGPVSALDAFEAEARSLVRRGGLELVELAAYDLFPFTEHVETVARFRRP